MTNFLQRGALPPSHSTPLENSTACQGPSVHTCELGRVLFTFWIQQGIEWWWGRRRLKSVYLPMLCLMSHEWREEDWRAVIYQCSAWFPMNGPSFDCHFISNAFLKSCQASYITEDGSLRVAEPPIKSKISPILGNPWAFLQYSSHSLWKVKGAFCS